MTRFHFHFQNSSVAARRSGFWRRIFFDLTAAAAACLVLQGCSGDSARSAAVEKPNTVPVVVTLAAAKAVPVQILSVGNVEALSTISVKAQVGGQLTRAYFKEGDDVKKGDPLFLIDPRPYEAAVSQAEATIARDTAQASLAEANLARDIAQEQYAREQARQYKELFGQGVLSKGQYDQVASDATARGEAVRADRAAIDSARASINASKAALDRAKLDLNYCTIVSPINGRTGNLMVKEGNVVGAGNVNLVTINEIQPIYVSFAVPESQLPSIKKYMDAGKLAVAAAPPNDETARDSGVLTFVDNAVDATTGTIKLKATFNNADRKLWPGQFVNVILTLTVRQNALVIPSAAVQTGPTGDFVFVVQRDMTVDARPVTVGMSIGAESVIDKGLVVGDTVVTEGQLRLTIGSKVQIQNAAQKNS